jgi:hypothetical protein
MAERVLPIVIDLGKKKKKEIQALKRGEGELAAEVRSAIADVKQSLGAEAASKELLPVVVVYKKKQKNGGRLRIPGL